jgi:hypothetical protein
MKKKNDYLTVWEWFLEMGPLKVVALIYGIAAVIMTIAMWALHWFTKNYH